MKKIVLLFFLSFMTLTVSAGSAVEVKGLWYSLDNITHCATIISDQYFIGYSGDVEIPDVIEYNGENYNVTAIDKGAFSGLSELQSVTIGNQVKTINESAFAYSSVTSAVIGKGVQKIDNFTFYSCKRLAYVLIGNGVTHIGTSAFHHCKSLSTVILGKSVYDVGESAFYDCENLRDVYFLREYPPYIDYWSYCFDGRYDGNMIIHVPESGIDNYAWSTLGYRSKEVQTIKDDELENLSKMLYDKIRNHE